MKRKKEKEASSGKINISSRVKKGRGWRKHLIGIKWDQILKSRGTVVSEGKFEI